MLNNSNLNPKGFLRRHPHTIGEWNENNMLYLGSGAKATIAHPCLRLTKSDARASIWTVPAWLKKTGLTYHTNPIRWVSDTELHAASRGQEFVSDIGNQASSREWLRTIQAAIQTDK